jgi:glycosyltransferase involved in cell wall biosynthesis
MDLAREQVSRGHSVGLVVDSLTGGERAAEALRQIAPTLELGILRLPIQRQPHPRDALRIIQIDAHASRLNVDVIHGHGSKGGLYARAPGLLRRQPNAIRCYTPHGGSFNHVTESLVHHIYMNVERLLAHVTSVLLFESVYIADRFHDRIGETRALVRTVQNGISPGEFERVPPNPDAADLLYVGELRAAKGIDTLLDATAMLSRKLERPISLVLVGSGPDQDKLDRQARALGISDQVSFPGALPARTAFGLGKLLVVPSRAESLPYIVLEAAGAQIPMVATDVGGIGEIFGPYRGRLIRPDNPSILASAIEDMSQLDPQVVRKQADDLAAFVAKRFSISKMADSVMLGYRDAFANRDRAPRDPKRAYALPF